MATLEAVLAYQEMRALWRADPLLYARARLGINPTPQQEQLLEALAPFGARVTARAGHGIGKTTVLAIAIWWHLECFDYSKTPCTAPTATQLHQVLWSEIAKVARRSDEVAERFGLGSAFRLLNLFRIVNDRVYDPSAPTEWYATARTARKEAPDALQGYHATDLEVTAEGRAVQRSEAGGSIMFVVDEASGVPDPVIEVIEGALSSGRVRFLMAGNPVRTTGFFARSHREDAAFYQTFHFSTRDSPLPAESYRDDLVKKYGEGSNVVRVRADGEFPLQDDDVLIPLALTEAAVERDRLPDDGTDAVLGVDVARFGSDRTTYVLRVGRRVPFIDVRAKEDTMTTVGRLIDLVRQFRPHRVAIDEIGVGSGVVDRAREQLRGDRLTTVIGVNVAEAATFPRRKRRPADASVPEERYDPRDAVPRTLRDYLWLAAYDWLRDEEPSFYGADRDHARELAAELSTVKYGFDSSGRLVIESKDERRKRGLRSPDLAEGLLMTFAPGQDPLAIWKRLRN